MAEPEGPVGFWSYTRSDDENSDRELTRIRLRLKRQLQLLVGRPIVDILQDEEFIPRGTDWLEQIHQAIDRSLFFIPIVTPGFLHSEMCCKEVMLFREREVALGRNDLIFPFHYIDTSYVQPIKSADCLDPEVLKLLRSRQGTKFHDLRNRDQGREDVGLRIGALAKDIDAALRKPWLPLSSRETEPVAVPGTSGATFVFAPPPAVPASSATVASGAAPPPTPVVPANPASSPQSSLGGGASLGGVGAAGGGRVSGGASLASDPIGDLAFLAATPTARRTSTGRPFPGRAMLGLAVVAVLVVLGAWVTGFIGPGHQPAGQVAMVTPPAAPASSTPAPSPGPKPAANLPAPATATAPDAQVKPSPTASPDATPQPAAPATQPAADPKTVAKPPDPPQAAKPEPAPFSAIWAKGCDTCPEFELVLIPAGTVNLGVTKAENDREKVPDWARTGDEPRAVPVQQPFYLGRTHVTRAQFTAFMDNKTSPFPKASRDAIDKCLASFDDPYNKTVGNKDQHPIVCTSYDDAMAYLRWLNKGNATGPYRLPSEVEWEYAARGERVMKTPSPARYWDSDNACLYANVSDASLAGSLDAARKNPGRYFGCDDRYKGTSLVGTFRANGFELKDMLGNAWQWVADCYFPTYSEPRIVNENPRDATQGCQRVLRGGSWYDVPWDVRAGSRSGNSPGIRDYSFGFRVARTLSPL